VLSPRADRLTCAECEVRLPEYIQVQIEGGNPEEVFPQVHEHLTLCPSCEQTYHDLLRMDTLVLSDKLPQPTAYSPPDLSFLHRLQVPEVLGELVRGGAYWAQGRARRLLVDMGVFFRMLGSQPDLALALAVRGEEYTSREVLYQVALGPEELDDLDVEVTVYRKPDQPDLVRVVVEVRVPSRLLEGFAGGRVEMESGGRIRVAETDEDGQAVFDDVPLVELKEARFVVIPPGDSGEESGLR